MINTERPNLFLLTFINCLDALFNLGIFVAAYFICAEITIELDVSPVLLSRHPDRLWLLLAIGALIIQAFFFALGLYSDCLLRTRRVIGTAVMADALAHALVLVMFLITLRGYSEFVLVWMLISMAVSLFLIYVRCSLIGFALRIIAGRRYSLKRILVVSGSLNNAERFIKELEGRINDSRMIIGYVSDIEYSCEGNERLGVSAEIGAVIEKHRPTDVVYAKGTDDEQLLGNLLRICEDRCIDVYIIPDTNGFLRSPFQLEIYGSLPLINVHATPLDSAFNAFLKRTVDLFGSVLLIILAAPVMLAAAIGVKLSSPGPILFKQTRIGHNGRPFAILKFRSMRVNSVSDIAWSGGEDERKTRFGNFLRRTAIDELPQLFNVLAGSMSLVGPRPELPRFVEDFRKSVPLYMLKHKVKPGMTGLAQIRGHRGDTSIEDRISSDIEYIENWSLMLDIAILLRTPIRMINKRETHRSASVQNTVKPADDNASARVYKKKILYAASTYGHLQRFHLKYMDALRSDGYEVKTMARGDGADYDVPFEKKIISPSNSACRQMIKKIIALENFDVIILNTSLAAFHIRLALRTKRRPRVINIVHGYLFDGNTPFLRRGLLMLAERLLASRTDDIIAMNRYDERIATNKRLCRGRVVLCRGMGAAITPQTESWHALRAGVSALDKYVITFVGELSERKNHKLILYAMPELLRIIPNAQIWFIGDGELRHSLEDICQQLSITDSVRFFGHRENVGDFVRASDIYLSPSLSEGMPFNVIEALGYKKLVLASRVKGHIDLLSDGAGVLFDPFSADDMLDKLLKIYKGEIKPNRDKAAEVFALYSEEDVFDETYTIIKELL